MTPFERYLDDTAAELQPLAPNAASRDWLMGALTAARCALAGDGHQARYTRTLAALPEIECAQCIPGGIVEALPSGPLTSSSEVQLRTCLGELMPWRKGPFALAGVTIDAEWRSDLKWARVLPHVRALNGRCVLDVGCGNGYYTWRMLGAGAALVVGLDPAVLPLAQFLAVRRYLGPAGNHLIGVGSAALTRPLEWFDTVFSMGVLYHRREPLTHLRELRRALRGNGELVLETLVIDATGLESLVPVGRYAQMRNVHAVPSCLLVARWLEEAGFHDVRCVDRTATTADEQRRTAWMNGPSLADFLDPVDVTKTIEGHPAPLRAVFIAQAQ